jgi:hypothetical protein
MKVAVRERCPLGQAHHDVRVAPTLYEGVEELGRTHHGVNGGGGPAFDAIPVPANVGAVIKSVLEVQPSLQGPDARGEDPVR